MAEGIRAYLRSNVLGLVALFVGLGAGAYAAGLVALPATVASGAGLELSDHAAVPGQVIVISAPGLSGKPKVKIGHKKAEVVSKKHAKLGVRVPELRPGRVSVVVRLAGKRGRGQLTIKRGFSGQVKPDLEPLRAVSAEIGAAGGTVTASGSDGTVYSLAVPAGALITSTTITLTPLASLGGLPGGGDAQAVQFAPEGLRFASPAVLQITTAGMPKGAPVGLAYKGAGSDLTLTPMSRQGGTLSLEVPHFSGAGATSISQRDFERLVAQLAAAPVTLEAAAHFFRDYRAVPEGWCEPQHPTCFALLVDIQQFLGTFTTDDCLDAAKGSFIDLHLNTLALLLSLEGDAGAVGQAFPKVANCRQTLTQAMLDLTRGPGRTDPLGRSDPCSGVRLASADYDGDGTIVNVECLLLVAANARVQGFDGTATVAERAITDGMQKVLDDGKAKCDGPNFLDGKELLTKGLKIAAVSVLGAEFANAIADCKEKIKVAPQQITLAPGAQTTFTATTNYTSPDIRWSASGGTIPSAGNTVQYTAPTQPGAYTITASDLLLPGVSGKATVTVQGVQGILISLTLVGAFPQCIHDGTSTDDYTADYSINRSQPVTWRNDSSFPLDVRLTNLNGGGIGGEFTATNIAPGATVSHKFGGSGDFDSACLRTDQFGGSPRTRIHVS